MGFMLGFFFLIQTFLFDLLLEGAADKKRGLLQDLSTKEMFKKWVTFKFKFALKC